MTAIIVTMLLLAYVLIATGHMTGVNKAAIAMFLGTVGWVVYVSWGEDFVMARHPQDYLEWLNGVAADSETVKLYIYIIMYSLIMWARRQPSSCFCWPPCPSSNC